MMIQLRNPLHVLPILALLLAISGVSTEAQPRRVAGVSVTVGDVRSGPTGRQEADLTVQVTTIRSTTGTGMIGGPGLEGEGVHKTHYAYGGQLGDLRVTYLYGPYTTTLYPAVYTINIPPTQLIFNFNVSGTIQYSYFYRTTVDGGLPAIDYGDGVTVPATTVPMVSSATTGGGGIRRVFRGTFTHTYATPGDYTVRVASACCPGTGTTPDTGSAVTFGAYPGVLSYLYAFNVNYNVTGSSSFRVINSTVPSTNTYGPYAVSPGTYTYTSAFTTPLSTLGRPAQMVNSATVPGLAVMEVPISSGGLLFLASLLALAGWFVLRRS
jgi:hypothetical protein